MKAYKLLKQDMTSHNDCAWVVGEWKETSGEGELCSEGWLHCYRDPLLAVLHDPIHGRYGDAGIMWEVEVGGKEQHDGWMKSGYSKMRLVQQIDSPVVTTEQRVRYGILCTKEVYKDPVWNAWADDWLSGKDRTKSLSWDVAGARAWEWVAPSPARLSAKAAAQAAKSKKIDFRVIAKKSMTTNQTAQPRGDYETNER